MALVVAAPALIGACLVSLVGMGLVLWALGQEQWTPREPVAHLLAMGVGTTTGLKLMFAVREKRRELLGQFS